MTLRRDFLSFTAGAIAARTVLPITARAEGVTVTVIPTPDAELIAVCAEFDALDRQINVIYGDGPGCIVDDGAANTASDPAFARMHVLLDRMDELRATTPAGIQARAHSLAQHGGHGEYTFDCSTTMVGRLLAYLMRDAAALGGSVAAFSVPPSPDAKLLEACAAYHACEASRPVPIGQELICRTPECDRHEAIQYDITERANELVHGLADMPAVTRQGMQAKARAILLWDGGNALKGEPDDYAGDRLMASLMRDLLAMPRGAA